MIDDIEFVRTVAVARITMPRSMVRLSAGRESMSESDAGALLPRRRQQHLHRRQAADHRQRRRRRRRGAVRQAGPEADGGGRADEVASVALNCDPGSAAEAAAHAGLASMACAGQRSACVHAEVPPDRQSRRDRLPDHPHRAAAWGSARSRSIRTPTPRRCTCAWRTRRCTSARARRARAICVGDKIIAAAKATGAEAIHPGYGFLSENADFAQAVIDAGLIWVGPKPDSIRAMGLKDAAKKLMAEAGVPVTPGYLGEDQSPEAPAEGGRRDRLSGADQGGRRRRRQGHAPGRRGRGLRRRARQLQARGGAARSATTAC